jgi:hypothetical protein
VWLQKPVPCAESAIETQVLSLVSQQEEGPQWRHLASILLECSHFTRYIQLYNPWQLLSDPVRCGDVTFLHSAIESRLATVQLSFLTIISEETEENHEHCSQDI